MSNLLVSVIDDLIHDRREQAQVTIHDYILGRMQQLAGLTEAKISPMNFSALKGGETPDEKTKAALQKMCDAAEKKMLKDVVANPDNFGIDTYETSKAEIRSGTNVWAQFVTVYENGFKIALNVDTDNIGGDSTNHEEQYADASGKIVAEMPAFGKLICSLDVQSDFMRDD
jgi:hypothetical protein